QGDQIYYEGPNPQSLRVEKHNAKPFPQSRSFPGYPNPLDMTNHVSDLYKLKLTWTSNKNADGLTTSGQSQLQKSAGGTLTVEGDAYRLLKQWLIDDVSALLNSVDVTIEHSTNCGSYIHYSIKAADLRWCEESTCTFDVTLKQKDDRLTCIKRTMI